MKYSYSEFVGWIKMGEEIDFKYKGNQYWISHNEEGSYLTKTGDQINEQVFKNEIDLLNNATIDGFKLKEIWDDIEL